MSTNLVPKSSKKYCCENCDYYTFRKSQYDRHLSTDKHLNQKKSTIINQKVPKSSEAFECICGKKYKEYVIELNRLCLLNNVKNQSSFLVGNSIKMLPKPKVIVSYADIGQGHVGYVYQATNFLFTGTTKERTDMSAGEGKHSRHAKDPLIRQFRTAKHRYVYIHGNKTEKKLLQKELKYEVLDYPKGDCIKYDSGGVVRTQNLLFGA